jgi:2-polyprenyl-3-methyl-5-hydroxy-6-metoxy-1,4-benzoquinol methylase
MKEPFMEPVLRRLRIGKVLDEIKRIPDCTLLDVGCGFNHKFLSTVQPYIANGVGIDFKVPEETFGKITTIQTTLNDTLPFSNNSFDIITMLAVLEHLEQPDEICSEIARVLKPGGRLILTVPGKRAQVVLEFMAYRLGIVNRVEIEDHKKYYDLDELQELVDEIDTLKLVSHKCFQLGMNNFCIIQKEL